jgi:hypothetical protein
MKPRRNSWRTRVTLFYVVTATALIHVSVGLNVLCAQDKPGAYSKYVDDKGNISLPDDFKASFYHLGNVAVAPKEGLDVTELHGSYTRNEDLKEFQRLGQFQDGAILVKEVRATDGANLTTGRASFAAKVKIWFVMVKDSKGRFPESDLWGDGWGWALFDGSDPKKQIATDYRSDCRACHVPAKATGWIYTQCYPALKKIAAETDVKTSSNQLPQFEGCVADRASPLETTVGKSLVSPRLALTNIVDARTGGSSATDITAGLSNILSNPSSSTLAGSRRPLHPVLLESGWDLANPRASRRNDPQSDTVVVFPQWSVNRE